LKKEKKKLSQFLFLSLAEGGETPPPPKKTKNKKTTLMERLQVSSAYHLCKVSEIQAA